MTERYFNTEGANQEGSYILDPLVRINIDDIETLISRRKYFIMHAPRQSGKTTSLLALRDYLNAKGSVYAVYANIESGQAARNDISMVAKAVVQAIADEAAYVINNDIPERLCKEMIDTVVPIQLISRYLEQLCRNIDRPLVLFLDEIDALIGDSLVSVLRQLRAGYAKRPAAFPVSVILCGVRDIRDYRIHMSSGEIITGGSAFNIKAESLRLGNFSLDDIRTLYEQHTADTGQVFDEDVYPEVWRSTEGQPWLVNAMARTATWDFKENRDRSTIITGDIMLRAKETIIYKRETHIDCLIDKLSEPRVKRIIEPILCNSSNITDMVFPTDDLQYVIDLGLIAMDRPIRIANEIYREVIPRELTFTTQAGIVNQPNWYTRPDNTLDMCKLLENFQDFYRQNIESWSKVADYEEAAPQLLIQAFLQRIVNGGGMISREYGLGRNRTDLLVIKPLEGGLEALNGKKQFIAIELKIKRGNLDKVISDGLEQTAGYMEKCAKPDLREGHFIVFNQDSHIITEDGKRRDITWDDKIFHEERQYKGYTIHVWGM